MNKRIEIYSHPRSGTHFLQSFVAQNFYKGQDLSSNGPIYYGHWSNKLLLEDGEPNQKIFGNHFIPKRSTQNSKKIYIYRDGRDVISSLWNSKFYNKDWEGITFSEFIRKKLDWEGGPGQKKNSNLNIVQHWFKHVDAWHNYKDEKLLIVSYEDLKNNPKEVYLKICRKFFYQKYLKHKFFGINNLETISGKVGLKPNKAIIHGWKNLFSEEDLEFFYNQLPEKKYLHKN